MRRLHHPARLFWATVNRWPRLARFVPLCVLVVVALLIEESYLGLLDSAYGNRYNRVVYPKIDASKRRDPSSPHSQKIAVVTVVEKSTDLADYTLAVRTLRCYCLYHQYEYLLIDLSTNTTLAERCPQPVFMYRRHCIVAEVLRSRPDLDNVAFMDADMGVINPNHLLEDYLSSHSDEATTAKTPGEGDKKADLIFAERLFTNELMAGSYFARNTDFARKFLTDWAAYAHRLPDGGYGTDNAAIHMVFIEALCPNCSQRLATHCLDLWRSTLNYAQILFYTSCARALLGERNSFVVAAASEKGIEHRALLVTDTAAMWARDGWLTGDQWSPDDFILHGWQAQRRDWPVYGHWHSPLVDDKCWERIDLEAVCKGSSEDAMQKVWPYKDSFMRSNEWVRHALHSVRMETKRRYIDHLRELYDWLTR